jgi:tRNA G37 N-methylase TrmD
MKFKVFTLHPEIFNSFLGVSLIARGINKNIIEIQTINWRTEFGLGNYKQVDDKPFGGGSGMVLQAEPIYQALLTNNAVSELYTPNQVLKTHKKLTPNNNNFYSKYKSFRNPQKITISLTPRGYPLNQQMLEWMSSEFNEVNILCGRYEGFDSRVSELVDCEFSLGNFVLNGGEVPAMALIEGISRLIPNFVTKGSSVLHDSFSSELNNHTEQTNYIIGKNKLKQKPDLKLETNIKFSQISNKNLFDEEFYIKNILPFIEHPQYTRPKIWNNLETPSELINGDHKIADKWRKNWFKQYHQ